MGKKDNKNKKASFFKNRAKELRDLEKSLESQFKIPEADYSPLFAAAKKLEEIAESSITPTKWGYSIQNLILPLGSIRNIEPQGIRLKICIDCEIEAEIEKWENKKDDPFSNYSFHLSVFGEQNGIRYSRGFHIDRDSAINSKECHPLYHLHFYDGLYDNGEALKDVRQNRGSVNIRTPRFSHYPLDIVLGIGFYLLNFHRIDAFKNLINNDIRFSRLYADSQKRILEPYYLAISGSLESKLVIWEDYRLLCPQIV